MALVEKAFGDIITFTRASGGGRTNSLGQFEWMGTNVPRLTYDPVTLQPLGLLVEEQRTNLLLQSADFASASWPNKPNLIVASNVIASPDGASNGDLLTRSSTTSSFISQAQTKPASSAAYSMSVFVRKSVGDYVALRIQGTYPARADVTFNITTGVISKAPTVSAGFTLPSASIAPFGDWWIMSLSATSDASTYISAFISPNSGNVEVDGTDTVSNSAVYAWGAQLEAGSSSSSYIPTTTAQVTRAADVATVNTLSPWYNPLEGTIVVSGISNSASATLCEFSDGTSSNRWIFSLNKTGQCSAVVTGGVVFALLGTASNAAKIAGSLKLNNLSISISGGPALLDTSTAVPVVTTLKIGSRFSGLESINGTISSIAYYPRIIDVQQASA